MRTITFGSSGITVPDVCLGTMTFGTQTEVAEAHAQLDRAMAAGLTFIDTAEMYPVNPARPETVGRTEEIIGAWIARRRPQDLVLATKVTGMGRLVRPGEPVTGATLRRALEGSLRRLGVDCVDIYQLHWPNRGSYHFRQNWGWHPPAIGHGAMRAHVEDVLAAARQLIDEGKMRAFGLSNESAWGLGEWVHAAQGAERPVTIQNEYSLLCRLFDTDLAEACVNEDVVLLGYSPLAAGLLTGKYLDGEPPAGSRGAVNPTLNGRNTPRAREAVRAYLELARRHGLDPVHMALGWFRSRPFRAIPIFGARTVGQLEHALAGIACELPEEVVSGIEEIHRAHPMPF